MNILGKTFNLNSNCTANLKQTLKNVDYCSRAQLGPFNEETKANDLVLLSLNLV
jgi:hypothetical protein